MLNWWWAWFVQVLYRQEQPLWIYEHSDVVVSRALMLPKLCVLPFLHSIFHDDPQALFGGIQDVDIPFVAEHSSAAYFLHFDYEILCSLSSTE